MVYTGTMEPTKNQLDGYKIKYEGPIYSSLYGDGKNSEVLAVSAHHPEQGQIGHLYWHPRTGKIRDVLVTGEHQGKGIATEMFKTAQNTAATTKKVPTPKHSQDRTDAGEAWAKAVGGPRPRRSGRFH